MIRCFCDGGAKNNQDKKNRSAYGSYAVMAEDYTVICSCYKNFGNVTSNVAEYKTLIDLLEYLAVHFPNDDVLVKCDSLLAVSQTSGVWRCHKKHLEPFRDRVRELMKGHPWRLVWVKREQIVPVLGH